MIARLKKLLTLVLFQINLEKFEETKIKNAQKAFTYLIRSVYFFQDAFFFVYIGKSLDIGALVVAILG